MGGGLSLWSIPPLSGKPSLIPFSLPPPCAIAVSYHQRPFTSSLAEVQFESISQLPNLVRSRTTLTHSTSYSLYSLSLSLSLCLRRSVVDTRLLSSTAINSTQINLISSSAAETRENHQKMYTRQPKQLQSKSAGPNTRCQVSHCSDQTSVDFLVYVMLTSRRNASNSVITPTHVPTPVHIKQDHHVRNNLKRGNSD